MFVIYGAVASHFVNATCEKSSNQIKYRFFPVLVDFVMLIDHQAQDQITLSLPC